MWGVAIWLLKQLQMTLNTMKDQIIQGISSEVLGVEIRSGLPNSTEDGKVYIITEDLQ